MPTFNISNEQRIVRFSNDEPIVCFNCHEDFSVGGYWCDQARKVFCYACMHNPNFYNGHYRLYPANRHNRIKHQEWKVDKIEGGEAT